MKRPPDHWLIIFNIIRKIHGVYKCKDAWTHATRHAQLQIFFYTYKLGLWKVFPNFVYNHNDSVSSKCEIATYTSVSQLGPTTCTSYFFNPIVFYWPANKSHGCLQQPFLSFSVENELFLEKRMLMIFLASNILKFHNIPLVFVYDLWFVVTMTSSA